MSKISKIFLAICLFVLPILFLSQLNDWLGISYKLEAYDAQLTQFKENKDQYDIILLGRSLTLLGISPKEFSDILKQYGKPVKVFNFGVNGAQYGEVLNVIQKLQELKPKKLKWIFLEYPLSLNYPPRHKHTKKAVYWHTTSVTLKVLSVELEKTLTALRKYNWNLWNKVDLFRHLEDWYFKFFCKGRGMLLVDHLLGFSNKEMDKEKLIAQRNLSQINDGYRERKGNVTAHKKLYNKWKKRFIGKNTTKSRSLSTANMGPHFDMLLNEIRILGAQPVMVVHPAILNLNLKPTVKGKHRLPVIRANDYKKYRALYNVENWRDVSHLNHKGTVLETKILADQFARILDQNKLTDLKQAKK